MVAIVRRQVVWVCHLTSACSLTPAGVLVRRASSVHHRAVPKPCNSAGVPLKRGVRRTALVPIATLLLVLAPACSAGNSGPRPTPRPARASGRATATPPSTVAARMDAYYASHPEAVFLTDDVVKPDLIEKVESSLDCLRGKTVSLGVHMFAITIDTEGHVRDPKYMSERDQAVADCYLPKLKRWRYTPANKNGRPVSCVLVITLFVD
jgi:hypothetical protein